MYYNIFVAKVSYVDIPVEVTADYWRQLTPQDRYTFSRVSKKINLQSRKRKAGVSGRSLLPQIATLWEGLTQGEKDDWTVAGGYSGLNGWRLFVKDTSARIINELSGSASPSVFHQAWTGQLHIEAPADELKIAQYHPAFYYVYRKKTGTKSQYEPVKVTEFLTLPLELEVSYKNELVSGGAGSFAKLYANVWSLYQGRDISTLCEVSLLGAGGWQSGGATISSVVGQPIRYDLFIHIYKMTGDLFVDNIRAEHGGQNWVRDTYCDDINQGFTRAYYQIAKHWTGVVAPEGTWFESIYKDF